MVTWSRILKLVSSFRGWLQRWHTKLTCMVLLDDLDPSIPVAMESRLSQGESVLLNPRFRATTCLANVVTGENSPRVFPSRSGTLPTGPASGAARVKAVYSPVREGLQ